MGVVRILALTIAAMAGAGSLALPPSAGLAAAATATGSAQLHSLPATVQRQVMHRAISENPLSGPFKIVNADTAGNGPPYCLDANSAGPTAGKNGDKVQLWHCNGRRNQLWHIGHYVGSNYATLFNEAYPSECLNADDAGGLQSGRHVQLWR